MSVATVFLEALSILNIPKLDNRVQRPSGNIVISQHCNRSDHVRVSHLSLKVQNLWRLELSVLLSNGDLVLELRDVDALRDDVELLVNVRFCVVDEVLKPFLLHEFSSLDVSHSFLHACRSFMHGGLVELLVSD